MPKIKPAMNKSSGQLLPEEYLFLLQEIRCEIGIHPLQNMELIIEKLQKATNASTVLFGIVDKNSQLLQYRRAYQNDRFVQIDANHHTPICKKMLSVENQEVQVLYNEDLKSLIADDLLFENKLLKFFAGHRLPVSQDKDQLLCLFNYKQVKQPDKVVLLIKELANLLKREELQYQFQQRQLEEKEKYKAIFHYANDGIFLIDSHNIIIDCNPKIAQLFDCDRDEVIGKAPEELSPKYQADGMLSEEKAIHFVNKALAGKPQQFIWQHQKKNGQIFEAEVSLAASDWHTGNVIHAMLRDITEQRKNEKILIDARIKAEEADRLKSAFLANMSHEIRTPLNSIIGFSDIMLDEETTNDEKNQFLELISAAGKTLLQLIDDIIDISKIEAGQVRIAASSFDLHKVLEELLKTAENEQNKREKKHIELRLKKGIDRDAFLIETDPYRFKQIVMNLLTNALKFVDTGFIEFGYTKPEGGLIQFYVKDTGIGIERDKTHLLFKRFGQIDGTYKRNLNGTGLGLAICHSLVKLLGGKIWFDSEPGKGTTFYFTLPIDRKASMLNLEDEVFLGRIRRDWSGKSILIADDVEANYLFLKAVLKETKAKVLWAKNGEEAISIIHDKPDISIVLMDIRMPETDGYQATKAIKAIAPSMPVIAQTAFSETEDYQKALDAGCADYITKPISVVELLSIMYKLL